MYRETRSLESAYRYLQCCLYPDVPAHLYDRYLWFYKQLVDLQHHLVYGRKPRNITVFENADPSGETLGIAHVKDELLSLSAILDATQPEGLDEFLFLLSKRARGRQVRITVPRRDLAEHLAGLLGAGYTTGTIKYFATENTPLCDSRIIEMRREDEVYLEGIRPRRWPAYQVFLEQGIRFFGLIESDTLVSMCGLTPLTAFAYQIIGVETFAHDRRRQGNAKDVCAYALQEGLRSAKIVTWSTSLRNVASCKTAEALGFRSYCKLYVLESRIPRKIGILPSTRPAPAQFT